MKYVIWKYAINNVGSSYFKINLFFLFFLILNGSLSMKPLFLMVSLAAAKTHYGKI